nr:hypothetical protein [Tanacetum cinerariifolium]
LLKGQGSPGRNKTSEPWSARIPMWQLFKGLGKVHTEGQWSYWKIIRELEEQQEKEDMRMNKHIARDAKVARIHAEEELQGMIDSLDKSNETTAKLKMKGLNFEKEQVKKQKSSEEAPEIETSTKEKMKEMMQLVSVEDVYVQALQVKHPIIDWKVYTEEWKLYDLSGVHYLTAKDKEIFMLVEKDYPLRKGLALVMINYKLQVKNYSQMAEDLIRKIYNITNTPRRKEMPLPEVCTAIEEKKKKLPVKDR